jgi:hypothetical protein
MNANVDLYLQHFVQPPIERMSRSFRQISAIPQLLLPLASTTCAHRHLPKLNRRLSLQKVIKFGT